MELKNEFSVSIPIDQAWQIFTDLEKIAPCLPGANLTGVDGDNYLGSIRIKVGPITTTYKGVAKWQSLDPLNYRAELLAEGKEAKGTGGASAKVEANLSTADNKTLVTIVTDLSISGKVAQISRGVLSDVSEKLLSRFAERVEKLIVDSENSDESQSEEAEVIPFPEQRIPQANVGEVEVPEAVSQDNVIDLLEFSKDSTAAKIFPAAVAIGFLLLGIVLLKKVLKKKAN
ncbi:MAG: SRPBCC family protein [Acidimicrobiales bacterium]|nr:SRPBCC family protein [Acidimicrobiales bacterium]